MPLTQIVDHWLIFFSKIINYTTIKGLQHTEDDFFSIIKCNSFIGNETQFDTVHLRQM